MAKMRRGLAAISSHKSSLTLDGLRRPAPMAISAKMLAILQKVDEADKAHLADLRESARQEAEKAKKQRTARRRPAWTPAKKRSTTT
jgi:hypothetical protein